jgi:hypothetical protein
MTITIDGQRAVDLMRQAVKSKGEDYLYPQVSVGMGGPSCLYTTPSGDPSKSQPSCIVGHALAYAGTPIEVLHAIDFGGVVIDDEFGEYESEGPLDSTPIYDDDVLAWLSRNGIEVTREAVDAFRIAQNDQDNGVAWGEAVERAQRAL